MDAFIIRRGGGGASSLFAAIGAEYPEGSTCTCENNATGKKMKAKDSSGKWVFAVQEAGEWTVTISDGNVSVSKPVTVEEGRVYPVKLSYFDGLIYYKGYENIATTGGLEAFNYAGKGNGAIYGTMTKGESEISLYTNGGNIASCPVNKLDLTEYSTLSINVKQAVASDGGTIRLVLFVADPENRSTILKYTDESANVGIKTLDVSAYDGEYYVGVGLWAVAGVTYTVTFDEMRLT